MIVLCRIGSMGVRLAPALAALVTAAALAPAASAHAPFLRPLNFSPSRDVVTVVGGMHEETVFVSDFALRSGDFWVIGPDGRRTKLEGQAALKGLSAVDVPLPSPGTYRVTTGDRIGREATMALVGGAWRLVRGAGGPGVDRGSDRGRDRASDAGRDGGGRPAGDSAPRPQGAREGGDGPPPIAVADVPPGAPTVKTTSVLKAETYVTRGAPSPGALKPSGEGFELEPLTNPDAVFLDGGFAFRLLNDGAPASGVTVHVRRGDEQYADTKTDLTVVTDAQGRGVARFPRQGAYILEARWPAAPAPGAAPPQRTTSLSVSLEATP